MTVTFILSHSFVLAKYGIVRLVDTAPAYPSVGKVVLRRPEVGTSEAIVDTDSTADVSAAVSILLPRFSVKFTTRL